MARYNLKFENYENLTQQATHRWLQEERNFNKASFT